mgnify:CR=1 FL=1
MDVDLTGADVLVITSSVYFKDRAVFDVDALEELSLGDFDVGGTDVDDETIENEFDVDDEVDDGVTGAAQAPERERFDFLLFSSALFSGGDLPFFSFCFRDPAMMKNIQLRLN